MAETEVDDIGRHKVWHIARAEWVWMWPPDISEGIAAGELQRTEP